MTKPKTARPGTLAVPSTFSTAQIYATIRAAMLNHVGAQGERLEDYVGKPPRVYVHSQPSPAVFPYLTLLLSRTAQSAYNGYRETAVLEVQAIGKPESQLVTIESAMDVVDQCLLSLTVTTTGLMVCRARTRDTVPQFSDPAEASVVGVVARYDLYLWPAVLTSR